MRACKSLLSSDVLNTFHFVFIFVGETISGSSHGMGYIRECWLLDSSRLWLLVGWCLSGPSAMELRRACCREKLRTISKGQRVVLGLCVCWGTSHFLLLPAACLCTLCCLGSEECNREKASNSQGTGSISMNGFSSLWREGH